MENLHLSSAVLLRLNGKIWFFICILSSLSTALSHALCWLHEFWPHITLQLSNRFWPQILQIKLILDLVITLFFDNLHNSLHMLTRKLPDVDTEFFFLSQRDGIFHRIGPFRLFLFDLHSGWNLCHRLWCFNGLIVSGNRPLIEIGLGNDLKVILLELLCDSCEIRIALVECITVADDFIDISMELSGCSVLSCFEVLLNFRQIHRLFNNFQIVWYAHGDGINRLSKRPWGFTVLQQIQYFHTWFERFIQSFIGVSSADFGCGVSWDVFAISNFVLVVVADVLGFLWSAWWESADLGFLLLILDNGIFYLVE